MATNTTNYNLVKPSEDEFYDVRVNNNNMDILDGLLFDLNKNKVAKIEGKGLSENDFTNELKDKIVNIGDIDDLNTEDKSSLVNAINEVNHEVKDIEIPDEIIQSETEPEGIVEGRLWLDLSEDVIEKTKVDYLEEDFNEHLVDYANHLTDYTQLKSKVETQILVRSNISILSTGWVDDTAVGGFWIYEIEDNNITEDTVVDVNIHLADLDKASEIKSATISSAGKVTIYADEQPTEGILCDIKIVRQVS